MMMNRVVEQKHERARHHVIVGSALMRHTHQRNIFQTLLFSEASQDLQYTGRGRQRVRPFMVVKVENNAGDMAQKLRIRKRNEYVSSFWIRNKGKSVLFPEDGLPLVENLLAGPQERGHRLRHRCRSICISCHSKLGFSPRYLGLTHSSKRGVKVPPRFAGIYIGHNVIPSEDVFVDHNAQFEREVRRVIFVCLL